MLFDIVFVLTFTGRYPKRPSRNKTASTTFLEEDIVQKKPELGVGFQQWVSCIKVLVQESN